jgi:chromosome segregation ATPase
VAVIDQLKRECIRLENEIMNEKLKLRGMEDEMKVPINAHRWRILESIDPQCIEIINRIHVMQKKLISVTDEVSEKDALISEKEKLSNQLNELLKKQKSGAVEIQEQIEHLRKVIKNKEMQLKAILAELKIARDEETSFSTQIGRLDEEMNDMKNLYIENMKTMTNF